MPVEDVVLVHLHQVEVVPDDGLGDVVPAGVHQDAAVGEPRRVHDLGSVDDILNQGNGLEYNSVDLNTDLDGVAKLHGLIDELAEGLHAPEDPPHGEGDDPGAARLVGGVHLDLVCNIHRS